MKLRSKLFCGYVLFVGIYAALTILPAPNHASLIKYQVSASTLRIVTGTYVLPQAIIWFAALYAYWRLDAYSRLIRNNKDGKQVAKLARGLYFLAVGMPAVAVIGKVLGIIANHNLDFTASSVIIRNYSSLVFPLLAFMWMSSGARGLTTLAKVRQSLHSVKAVALAAITLGMLLCCLIVSAHQDLRQTYHMSAQLVIITLALPYTYIWFLGLFSVAELHAYSLKVAGVVYRKAWNMFAVGLIATIVLSIAQEYLNTATSWLAHLSLVSLMLLLYILLLLLTAGYTVLALATKRLTKIEEV